MNVNAFVSGVMLSAGALTILMGLAAGNLWQTTYGLALAAWAIERILRKGTPR